MTVLRTKVNGLWTDIAGDVSPIAQVPQNVLDFVSVANAVPWLPTNIWQGATSVAMTPIAGWQQNLGGMVLCGFRANISANGVSGQEIQFPTPVNMNFGFGFFYFHIAGVVFHNGTLRSITSTRFNASVDGQGGQYGVLPSINLKPTDNLDMWAWIRPA